MLADEVDYVIGVDTHRDQHMLAVVVAPTGAVVAQRSVRPIARGYAAALRFAERHAPRRSCLGDRRGRPLRRRARSLPQRSRRDGASRSAAARRAERRLQRQGRSTRRDPRGTLGPRAPDAMTLPRAGERQEALRVLLLARRSAVDVRRLALVQLRSVIVTAPESVREELRRLPVGELLRRCSRFRRSSSRTPDELAIVLVLRSLARRIEAATEEADELEREILGHVRALVPELLERARRRPDRRRATDRHLVTPRPRPLRSRLRSPRRRRTTARLERTDDPPPPQPRRRPPTQPRPPHRHPPPPPTRPRDHATTSPAASPRARATRDATRILKRYLARHLYRVMQNASPSTT